jgi:hypothetical protein
MFLAYSEDGALFNTPLTAYKTASARSELRLFFPKLEFLSLFSSCCFVDYRHRLVDYHKDGFPL